MIGNVKVTSESSDEAFERVYETIPGNGWLTKEEANLLWNFAGQFEGPILEVGCYKGRSTVLLASLGRAVYSVDPFLGFDSSDPGGEEIRREFLENISSRRIDNVILCEMRIELWRPQRVGFAYLDGDHSRLGTLNQIGVALECRAEGIAIHDIADSGEGKVIADAARSLLGNWDDLVGRLAVWSLR